MTELSASAEVDQHACIGSGNCLDIAPAVFKFDENDKAYFNPAADVGRAVLIDAQQACPSGAITLTE